MKRPTVRRATLALTFDSLIVYATYILIGIMSYLPFAATPSLKAEIL